MERFYVVTDADGEQRLPGGRTRRWPLPEHALPGAEVDAGDAPLELLVLEGVLGELGDRIFHAEPLGDTTSPGGDRVEVGAARLVSESAWDRRAAATFALDCAEHVLATAPDPGPALDAGVTEVIASARRLLSDQDGDNGLLARIARRAAEHRLRRDEQRVADASLGASAVTPGDDLENPTVAGLSAVVEALYAAMDALRDGAPRRLELEDRSYERDLKHPPVVIDTPIAPIERGAHGEWSHPPAWAAAHLAAERARQAAHATGGHGALLAERAWQLARLADLLGDPAPS